MNVASGAGNRGRGCVDLVVGLVFSQDAYLE
jgi:hypothetical protein